MSVFCNWRWPSLLAGVCFGLCFSVGAAAQANKKEAVGNGAQVASRPLDLVNKSGRQRMLSQRVAKAYFQLVLKLQPEKSHEALTRSLTDLRAAQADMKGRVGDDLAPLVVKQAILIEQLAALVNGAPSSAMAPAVDKAADALLANAEQLTEGIRKSSGTTTAGLLNLAARQRMLSQRIAKEFLLYQLTASADAKAAFLQAAQDFSTALGAFDSHKAEFPGVSGQIGSAKIQMVFLEDAIRSYESPSRQQMESVVIASDHIHDEMNTLAATVQKALENR